MSSSKSKEKRRSDKDKQPGNRSDKHSKTDRGQRTGQPRLYQGDTTYPQWSDNVGGSSHASKTPYEEAFGDNNESNPLPTSPIPSHGPNEWYISCACTNPDCEYDHSATYVYQPSGAIFGDGLSRDGSAGFPPGEQSASSDTSAYRTTHRQNNTYSHGNSGQTGQVAIEESPLNFASEPPDHSEYGSQRPDRTLARHQAQTTHDGASHNQDMPYEGKGKGPQTKYDPDSHLAIHSGDFASGPLPAEATAEYPPQYASFVSWTPQANEHNHSYGADESLASRLASQLSIQDSQYYEQTTCIERETESYSAPAEEQHNPEEFDDEAMAKSWTSMVPDFPAVKIRLKKKLEGWEKAVGLFDNGNEVGPIVNLEKVYSLGYRMRDINLDERVKIWTLGGDIVSYGMIRLDYRERSNDSKSSNTEVKTENFNIVDNKGMKYDIFMPYGGAVARNSSSTPQMNAMTLSRDPITKEEQDAVSQSLEDREEKAQKKDADERERRKREKERRNKEKHKDKGKDHRSHKR